VVGMMDWTQAGTPVVASCLASMVEFVEALTVVLAVGTVRGWRPALVGAAAALALSLMVLALGPSLTLIPLAALQLLVGLLLLLFGLRWLRKAILRAAGVIALHDEAAAFRGTTEELRRAPGRRWLGLDAVALSTSFKIVMLEEVEVVFIVIALSGGGHALLPPVLGAAGALLMVVALGLVLHRPLARVPENTLKFCVGVLLSAFGTFWVGEGVGAAWPGQDGALPVLIAGFLTVALAAIPLARRRHAGALAASRVGVGPP
jgi:Ca2+/H+ antiporter, TMEM165/GDT1 family